MPKTTLSIEERFWMKVSKKRNGCWLWTAAIDPNGYPVFTDENSKKIHAHRWAYRYFVGPIPEGYHVDHQCRVKHCVNFEEHLKAMTPRANFDREPNNAATRNRKKTHCKSGHALEGRNLYVTPDGRRMCRDCQRERESRYRQKVTASGG